MAGGTKFGFPWSPWIVPFAVNFIKLATVVSGGTTAPSSMIQQSRIVQRRPCVCFYFPKKKCTQTTIKVEARTIYWMKRHASCPNFTHNYCIFSYINVWTNRSSWYNRTLANEDMLADDQREKCNAKRFERKFKHSIVMPALYSQCCKRLPSTELFICWPNDRFLTNHTVSSGSDIR